MRKVNIVQLHLLRRVKIDTIGLVVIGRGINFIDIIN